LVWTARLKKPHLLLRQSQKHLLLAAAAVAFK
jgi:hypothetical protein